jgi:predicted transcriptional regulator
MRVLWDKGEATVRDIMGGLIGRQKPAYNTVQTMLRILESKGHVRHRKNGRAFIFWPTIDRTTARRSALQSLVNRFFEGSPRLLVLNLLEDRDLSEDALKQIRQRLREDA